MKEDRNPFRHNMITICQVVERLSTLLQKSVRNKALLLFICALYVAHFADMYFPQTGYGGRSGIGRGRLAAMARAFG